LGLIYCLEQYVAEITALFIPYLSEDIKDSQWVKLQTALTTKLSRMYQETHPQQEKHDAGKK